MGTERRIPSPLTVGFVYTGTVAAGDALTPNGLGGVRRKVLPTEPYVGQVYAFETLVKELTAVVPFTYHRDTRLSGEELVPGFFRFGASNAIFQVVPDAPAVTEGSVGGPYAITVDVNDTLKVRVGAHGAVQTFTLTAGVAVTAAAIAAEINESAVGFIASLNTDGQLMLTALAMGVPIEIVQDTVSITSSSAGPYTTVETSADGLVVKVGSGGNQTFTFTAGAQSAAAIANTINATALNFRAQVTVAQELQLVAALPRTALEIISSGSTAATALGLTVGAVTTEDCYTALGLTPGAVDPVMATLPPCYIDGVVMTAADEAGVAMVTLEY